MNKRIIYAGLATGVFAFFFGWLFYGILLMDLMKSMSTESMNAAMLPEEQMNFPFLIISNLVWGFFMAYVLGGIGNVTTWQEGAIKGAIVGLLIGVSYDTGFYAMSTLFSMNGMLMDIVAGTVMSGAMGAVAGFVLGKVKE